MSPCISQLSKGSLIRAITVFSFHYISLMVCICFLSRAWRLYNHYHLSHDQAYLNMAHKLMVKDALIIRLDMFLITQRQEISLKNTRYMYCTMCKEGILFFFSVPLSSLPANSRAATTIPSSLPRIQQPATLPHLRDRPQQLHGNQRRKALQIQRNTLWMVDTNEYYTSTSAKYLTYSNPLDLGDANYPTEIHALKSALMIGVLLERVVILPKFHCCNCKTLKCYSAKHQCSLLHMLKVKSFDDVFQGKYREASFLEHPLVPENTKIQKV